MATAVEAVNPVVEDVHEQFAPEMAGVTCAANVVEEPLQIVLTESLTDKAH